MLHMPFCQFSATRDPQQKVTCVSRVASKYRESGSGAAGHSYSRDGWGGRERDWADAQLGHSSRSWRWPSAGSLLRVSHQDSCAVDSTPPVCHNHYWPAAGKYCKSACCGGG